MAEFTRFAPTIDRLFRFVEMIGVTALLGTVLVKERPIASQWVLLAGTFLAITYLIEPLVDWVAGKVIGEKIAGAETPWWRLLAAFLVLALSTVLSFKAAPYVGELTVLISHTIR